MNHIKKLISISSRSIEPVCMDVTLGIQGNSASIHQELLNMLRMRNGFYVFESSLHVLPSASNDAMCLKDWNAQSLWRYEYEKLAEDLFFFAEDAIGNQFGILNDQIWIFDAETGGREAIASSLDQWAEVILKNYNAFTNYKLMHDWQIENGAIRPEMRLAPKIPFVLGGAFDAQNLIEIEASTLMKSLGNLALQILNIPDGSKIAWRPFLNS